ncbi:hypothetical protein N7G274_002986 [Stereocaulon virgatum]|uniref:ERCC4 domain-containing protein n=1 Tax=Stereocaulon virgatum TaxID=373712 RepID=A0ABR4AHI2_9LECA
MMAPSEVVDLLSTDDEATVQWPPTSKAISVNNQLANSDILFLSDDFDSTINFEAPSKRRRINRLPAGEENVSTSPGLPIASKRRASPEYTYRSKASDSQDWLSIDRSDPIIFTSSIDVGATVSRANRNTLNATSFHDEDSDDTLPENVLAAPLRKSKAASALSERTAAVLASFSQSPPRAKASTTRKASCDKTASKLKNIPQGSIDRRGAAGVVEIRSPKKRKLTEEERTAKAADDERDKVARTCEKATKRAANKEKKAKEKEEELERKRIQKEEKAREKRIAADLAEVNKSKLDKKDSTPEMIVDLPASMDGQSVDTQIREFLKTLGVDATLYQSPTPNTIRWRRKMKARWNADLHHWEPIERMEIHDEKHIMCLLSAKDFVALAMAESNDENVETHVAKLKSAYKDCIPIYMIEGLHACIRKSKTAENRAYQERVNSRSQNNAYGLPPTSQHTSRKQKPMPLIVDEDIIEDALLRLQVMDGCLIHHTNTSVETAEWVANFTQHISTIPYRIQRMNLNTTFCMESGQVETGEDKDDTFVKMLQEIHHVTPPIAYGIASNYANVISLIKAFRTHGPLVLKDLQKSANRNGALTDRKIGPAISRRLYKIFTELDSTSTDV